MHGCAEKKRTQEFERKIWKKERKSLEDLAVHKIIILECILKKWDGKGELDLTGGMWFGTEGSGRLL